MENGPHIDNAPKTHASLRANTRPAALFKGGVDSGSGGAGFDNDVIFLVVSIPYPMRAF